MTAVADGGVQPQQGSSSRSVLSALVALVFLNGMLSFSTWWPTPGVVADARIAPEFVWTWVALLALVAWRRQLPRGALTVFALVYALLVVGRYADVTAPALFGRPINVYWDGMQLPRFLWVTMQDLAWWQSAGLLLVIVLAVALLLGSLRLALKVVARDVVPYAQKHRWVWALTAAAVALVCANHAGMQATWPFVSKPVVPTYWRQAKLMAATVSQAQQARVLPPSVALDAARAKPPESILSALKGRDVYLIMLESVGAVVYDDPRAQAAMATTRKQFLGDIEVSGRKVATGFFKSPTFAGGSDLAQLGVLSGLDLTDPMRHDVLLTTQRPTLISLFREQGYKTYGLYSALSWDWPERAFYGFDVFVDRRQMAYPGPAMGFWEVPDQYTAAWLDQAHPRTPDQPPRFVFFPTITNHLPFSPAPPYQPDWSRMLTPQPYDEADMARVRAAKPQWLEMFSDYMKTVSYTYTWLGSWLRQPEAREAVYVLVGDHQPAANVTGEGVSWDVPVHFVTRDAALLARFVAMGFAPGLETRTPTLGGLHDLTGMMLDVFAGATGAQRATHAAGKAP